VNRNELLDRIKPETDRIDQAMRQDLATLGDTTLFEIINYACFNGGKRFRPLLCVLAGRLCGRPDDDIYRLAIAFEYLHAATLLHDDVVDKADQRRGRPSANTVWGNTAAILTGDYLHARSLFLLGDLGRGRCLEIICRTTAAMVEGELLQMRNARNFNQSEADYFTVITRKSALLIAAVCEIGAIYGRGGPEQTAALRAYGLNLGIAFQIVDDLLDYLGDSKNTGKAVGNDFCECKMTLPLIYTLAHAENRDRNFLLALLAGPVETKMAALDEAREMLTRYGGFAYARQQAEQYVGLALASLDVFQEKQQEPERNILAGLAHYVLTRNK